MKDEIGTSGDEIAKPTVSIWPKLQRSNDIRNAVQEIAHARVTFKGFPIVERWVNLLVWFATKTGRVLGAAPDEDPFDHPYAYSYAITPNVGQLGQIELGIFCRGRGRRPYAFADARTWEIKRYLRGPRGKPVVPPRGYDRALHDLIASVQDSRLDESGEGFVFDPPSTRHPELDNWWRFSQIDESKLERRRRLHDRLVKAARDVLTMSMPLDCYQSKPDYNSTIDLRLPREPPDRACWDELVSGDAVEAAVLLANLDNPYLTPGIGPGLVKQGKTASRRTVVKMLSRLKRKTDNQPLTTQQLAVLCLLAKPYIFVDAVDGIPAYLVGEGEWTPAPNSKSVKPESLFKSTGFMNLKRKIRSDLTEVAEIAASEDAGISRKKTTH